MRCLLDLSISCFQWYHIPEVHSISNPQEFQERSQGTTYLWKSKIVNLGKFWTSTQVILRNSDKCLGIKID